MPSNGPPSSDYNAAKGRSRGNWWNVMIEVHEPLPAGTEHVPYSRRSACFCCTNCGKWMTLHFHTIHRSGQVVGPVQCPYCKHQIASLFLDNWLDS